MRGAPLAIALILLTGCPSDRTADPTMRGSALPAPPPMRALAPPALTTITKLRGPESVLYDPAQDVYFISNINGAMLDVDGNGFISRVDPATMKVNLKWIASGLDGPKGMAILGDTLYVVDITAVRKFDRRTGAPLGEITIPSASFLNDITTDGQSLYVSDTGIRSGPGIAFYDTGTDAIWKISGDRPQKYADGPALQHPNGLDWRDGKLRVVTFRGNALYELVDGKRRNVAKMPGGQLDGVVHLADGTALISSWKGNEIYRAPARGKAEAILAGMDAPADLGYDTKRHRLLIPHPMANQVTVHTVQ
ncbi:MAG: SMP-30/gluconolactonase/LRE family protein [Thermoanaerobaculia bacterium]